MNTKKSKPVPVFMYHSVGIPNKQWNWNFLTCPYLIFENQLKELRNQGYESISLSRMYDYIFEDKPIPEKTVVFTFDDGYLDNWIFAYPILKKYGFQGTIFVNPEFVDEYGGKRKRIDEVSDTKLLETSGFLSWDEMRQMEQDGVMAIESHALTHTWYPKSDKVIDFRHPGDSYIWMTWNNTIACKHQLQIDDENLSQFGTPVYEHEKSLSGRRFYSDENLNKHMVEFVKNKGGRAFFEIHDWKAVLFNELNIFKSNHVLNERYETTEEYENRILFELQTTKSIIESQLGKSVDFHCWPGGSATKIGMKIADDLGFKLSNAANDILEIRYKLRNNSLYKINRLNRLVPILFYKTKSNHSHEIRYSNGKIILLQIKAFKGNKFITLFYKTILKTIQYFYQIKLNIK